MAGLTKLPPHKPPVPAPQQASVLFQKSLARGLVL